MIVIGFSFFFFFFFSGVGIRKISSYWNVGCTRGDAALLLAKSLWYGLPRLLKLRPCMILQVQGT